MTDQMNGMKITFPHQSGQLSSEKGAPCVIAANHEISQVFPFDSVRQRAADGAEEDPDILPARYICNVQVE